MNHRVLCTLMMITAAVAFSGCATTGTAPTQEAQPAPVSPGSAAESLDRQEKELAQRFAQTEGVNVQRLQETLAVSFKSDALFDVEASQIKPGSSADLEFVADILRKHPETRIEISGYTDSSGSEQHNLALSQQRAQAVGELLVRKGVDPSRITAHGYGETQFIASNATENGRQLNRRITLLIIPPGVRSLREEPAPRNGPSTLSMNFHLPGGPL